MHMQDQQNKTDRHYTTHFIGTSIVLFFPFLPFIRRSSFVDMLFCAAILQNYNIPTIHWYAHYHKVLHCDTICSRNILLTNIKINAITHQNIDM